MLIALIGVLGILLGGFLNASFSFLLARRAEKRETKTAARLVLPELLENRERLESALETKRWRYVDFRTGRWRQHELTIASGFGQEWGLLATVYTALMLLNEDRGYYEADEKIEYHDDLGYMQLAAENLNDAIRILQKWAGVKREVLMLPSGDRS